MDLRGFAGETVRKTPTSFNIIPRIICHIMITALKILLAYSLISLASLEELKVENNVILVNGNNIQDVMKKYNLLLLYFYSPSCIKCVQFSPVFQETAMKANKLGKSLYKFGEIDGESEYATSSSFGISYYPTLRIIKNGSILPYDGPMNVDGIIDFMDRQLQEDTKPSDETIVTLTSQNISEYIKGTKIALVVFMASWCKHCQNLYPELVAASKILKNNGIPVAKIVDADQDTLKSYGVTQYPLAFFAESEKLRKLNLDKIDSKDIVNQVYKRMGPGSVLAKNVPEMRLFSKRLQSRSEPAFIAVFEKSMTKEVELFMEIAKSMKHERNFIHSYNPDVAKALSCDLVPCLVVSYNASLESPYDKQRIKKNLLKGKDMLNKDTITEYLSKNYLPLVGFRNVESEALEEAYENASILVSVYFHVNFNPVFIDETAYVIKSVWEVANKYKDMTFCLADEIQRMKEMELFGLHLSGEEVNVAIRSSLGSGYGKYVMNDEFSRENLINFLEDYLNGDVRPYIRSRPVLDELILDRKDGTIIEAVGINFEKIVLTDPVDVLLIYYSLNNADSARMFNSLDRDTVKKIQEMGVRVVKIDILLNDVPIQMVPSNFPLIIYLHHLRSNTEKVKIFKESINGDNLLKFVTENLNNSTISAVEDTQKPKDEL